jgi:hypothetical protein
MEEATQTGALDQEDQFQSLFDAGAFEPPKQTEVTEQSQEEPQDEQPKLDNDGVEGDAAEEEVSYSSLNDLLTAHKIDPESVKSLPVTVKIDGQEKQVPLSDVIKSFQLEGHVNNKSIELSEARRNFEAEQQAARELVKQQIAQNQQLGNLAQQQLNWEYNQVDWNSLRVTNPAEFAAKMAEFQQRNNQIQGYMQQLTQQQQLEEQQRAKESEALVSQERQRMLDAVPAWNDPSTFAKDREQMVRVGRELGFTDAELGKITDHRQMRILHMAAQYQALQANKPAALKKVREAPAMAKPGTRTNTDPSQVKRQQVIERFNKNPRDQDAAAAMFELFS